MPFDGYKVEIIDFSNDYFGQKGDGLPEEREGKFVLVRDYGKEKDYLVLSPAGQCIYHTDIVEKFCRRFRIGGRKTERPRGYLITDPNWVVAGGGRWNWRGTGKRLRLHGESLLYGPWDLVVLRERLSKFSGTSEWSIEIEPVIHYGWAIEIDFPEV